MGSFYTKLFSESLQKNNVSTEIQSTLIQQPKKMQQKTQQQKKQHQFSSADPAWMQLFDILKKQINGLSKEIQNIEDLQKELKASPPSTISAFLKDNYQDIIAILEEINTRTDVLYMCTNQVNQQGFIQELSQKEKETIRRFYGQLQKRITQGRQEYTRGKCKRNLDTFIIDAGFYDGGSSVIVEQLDNILYDLGKIREKTTTLLEYFTTRYGRRPVVSQSKLPS